MSIRSSVACLWVIMLFVLAACGCAATPDAPGESQSNAPSPVIQTQPSPTKVVYRDPEPAFEPYTLPLSEPGPYFAGKRNYSFKDSDREDREVAITVWYPAVRPPDVTSPTLKEAEPDFTGAPYPVVLSSTKVASQFGTHLVSHGFVVASVDGIDTWEEFDNSLIDQPLDILFALEQAGTGSLEGLAGMLNAEQAGTIGYSFDGTNSLFMSGARVDPAHFVAECSDYEPNKITIDNMFRPYQCALYDSWEGFEAHAGEAITSSDDGLWQPMTDERIRAVMPLAPEGWVLFGERGLAAVDRPALIIVATRDPYYAEDVTIYEGLGTEDRTLISVIDQTHMMIFEQEYVAKMAHFAAAFFGYYLQDREEYAEYFSAEFVDQYPDLSWGPVSED